MRFHEFVTLKETTEELHVIKQIAKMLVDALPAEPIEKPIWAKNLVDTDKINTIPNITMKIIGMYGLLAIWNGDDPKTHSTVGGHATGKWIDTAVGKRVQNTIWLRRTDNKNGMISVLTHELQHALDNFKGAINKPPETYRYKKRAQWSDIDHDDYAKNQMEVNARFSQAADYISYKLAEYFKKGTDDIYNDTAHIVPIIKEVYAQFNLDRSLFVEGPKGDRAWKRLLSRGIVFWKYIYPLLKKEIKPKAPIEKPKLRGLISSTIDKVKSYIGKA